MSKRVLACVCLAAAIAPVAGCSSNFNRDSTAEEPTLPERRQTRPVDAADGSAVVDVTRLPRSDDPNAQRGGSANPSGTDTVEDLRLRSEAYAALLEAVIAERDALAADVSAQSAQTRSSRVEWIDPNQARVGLGSPDDQAKPHEPSRDGQKDRQPAPQDTNRNPEQLANADSTSSAVVPPSRETRTPSTKPALTANVDDFNTPIAVADGTGSAAVAGGSPSVEIEPPPLEPETRKPVAPAEAGQLLSRITARVKDNPRDIANHLEYQLLLFLMDEQVPDLASIATLPQEDRELVTAVLDGVSNLRATLRRDANALIGEKIRPVVELSDRLRTSAELSVPVLTLCSRVDGFGRYEPMEARFIAGKNSETIVYCEIENFASQYSKEGWESSLSMELSIFSEMGQQVYVEQPVQILDGSRSRRHDFFLRKIVKIPSNLTIGRYVLKVTIVDTQSNRVAETSLPMQIVAQ